MKRPYSDEAFELINKMVTDNFHLIPEHMHEGVKRYLFDGIQPGDFLTAVFENDFKKAAMHADLENVDAFYNWTVFTVHAMPRSSVGSPEAVQDCLGS